MDLNLIEKQLKTMSHIEQAWLMEHGSVKAHFTHEANPQKFTINSQKLMSDGEDIAIHRHDRFMPFEAHRHDYIELLFVYQGAITHHVGDETLVLKAGECLLMDMHVSHSIEPAGEQDLAVNILIRKAFFDWYFIKQIAYHDVIAGFVLNALYGNTDAKTYIHFKTSQNPTIKAFILEILGEFYENKNGAKTAIRGYMLLLFNALIRDYDRYMEQTMVKKIDASIVVEMMSYIDSHYQSVTLKDLADFFNYSQDYIGKQIKRHTGQTLKDILRDKKLFQAELLLKDTDLTIMGILDEIGYSNASYFYKQFKAAYGVTPDVYRKQQK